MIQRTAGRVIAMLAIALGLATLGQAATATRRAGVAHGAATRATASTAAGRSKMERAPREPASPPLADSVAFRVGEYQRLLDDFLRVTSKPGEPLETRFLYGALFSDMGRIERFAAIRHELLANDPRRFTVRQRHAWAIDTYNFLVIELVIENLVSRNVSTEEKGRGIFGIPLRSVRLMWPGGKSFFDATVVKIGDHDYSLDTFERAYVFDGYARPGPGVTLGPRPATLDPRAHFALVCAAIGCPPLQPRAFVPESLDTQLDRACRDALASPRHLSWDPNLKRLAASSVFGWYVQDFGSPAKEYEFIERYAPPELLPALEAKPEKVIDTTTPWDWDLNLLRRPQPGQPAPSPGPPAPKNG